MTAPVSVIVPTLNAATQIGPALGALVEGVADGLIREVILADGGSQDGIGRIADETGATLVRAGGGRGGQLREGAAAARGAWLLILHADTVLRGDWVGEMRSHLERHPDKAAYFRLRFDADGVGAWWVAGWANLRARLFGLPYGDQALLIPAQLYRELGGYPAIPLMEDVALVRRIGSGRLRALDAEAQTSAEKYRREGWFRRGLRNWRCLALYFSGVSPERIVLMYRGKGGPHGQHRTPSGDA